MESARRRLGLMWICLGVEVGSKLLSGRGNIGEHMNHVSKSLPNGGGGGVEGQKAKL